MTPPCELPRADTVEGWAHAYITSCDLAMKLTPPPPPSSWEFAARDRRIASPGRPASLVIATHAPKSPRANALRQPLRRAQLVHTFLHHELQAAELMAWALLAFSDTPRAFRMGLVHILLDEVRHMQMYEKYLNDLGHAFGEFPVRDWFWDRVPHAPTATHFVALMGIGFEGGNLDHTQRFAERFRAVGDERGARLQETVGEEEIPHVRFAMHWFQRWAEGDVEDFETWKAYLPAPLSPMVMRGAPIAREARLRSGFSEPFLDALIAWNPEPRFPTSTSP